MMIQIKKIGNSTGIILTKEMLQYMNVGVGDNVYISRISNGSFNITPYDPEFAESMKIVDEVMDEYRDTLRELAK